MHKAKFWIKQNITSNSVFGYLYIRSMQQAVTESSQLNVFAKHKFTCRPLLVSKGLPTVYVERKLFFLSVVFKSKPYILS